MAGSGTQPAAQAGIAGFFDAEAARYDAAHDAPTPAGHALRIRLAATLAMLAPLPPGEALDAGMGPGRLCAELVRRGWAVSGVDASEAMVQAARSRLPQAADRLVQSELEQLPFPDAGFDAVTATGVLEYVGQLDDALGELRRVVRPQGVGVVSIPHVAGLSGAWLTHLYYPAVRAAKAVLPAARPAPRGVRPPALGRFEAAVAAAGWRIAARRHVNPVLLVAPLDRLAPAAGVRSSQALEGRQGALARLLATQVVYLLRPIQR